MGLGDRLAVLLATSFYLSYIPSKLPDTAPWRLWARKRGWTGAGLVGTLAGLVLLPCVPRSPGAQTTFLAAAVCVAIWLCGRAEKALGIHDDPRIVLDEIVGFWATVAFLPRQTGILAAGFVLFRVLDAMKLPPYGWLGRLPGGAGIVADDIGAGICANLALRILTARGIL